jgi:excisionase family DNA binding protein
MIRYGAMDKVYHMSAVLGFQEFYSINEFASKLGVHPNTVRRAIKCGRIGALRLGNEKTGRYRIPHSEIERIIYSDLRKIFDKERI